MGEGLGATNRYSLTFRDVQRQRILIKAEVSNVRKFDAKNSCESNAMLFPETDPVQETKRNQVLLVRKGSNILLERRCTLLLSLVRAWLSVK